jgi:hypothetical protein
MMRGWLEHNPRRKIPLGCVTLIFLMGVFATILLTVVIPSFRNSDAYKQALAKAAGNSQVREQMGEPVKPSWFRSGQLQGNGSTGNTNLSIPLSGPKARRARFAPSLTGAQACGATPTFRRASMASGEASLCCPSSRPRERLLMRPKWALSNALEMETAFLGRTTQVE